MNFTTEIELEVFYGECRCVSVEYDYQPPEDRTRDYPGCAASVTVTGVMRDGNEYLHLIMPIEERQLEERCWDHVDEVNRQQWEREEAMKEDAAEARREWIMTHELL